MRQKWVKVGQSGTNVSQNHQNDPVFVPLSVQIRPQSGTKQAQDQAFVSREMHVINDLPKAVGQNDTFSDLKTLFFRRDGDQDAHSRNEIRHFSIEGNPTGTE